MPNLCHTPCGDLSCLSSCLFTRWEIVLDGENIWSVDGEPETFASEQEATQALADHFAECKQAFDNGFMIDDCSNDDYIIRKITL